MKTRTIEDVQVYLSQIIDELGPDDELVITKGDRPVARLIAVQSPKGVPIYGRGKDKFLLDAEDKSHLEHFSEYRP